MCGYGADGGVVDLGVERAFVGGVRLERDAPVAGVGDASFAAGGGGGDGELEAGLEGIAGAVGLVAGDLGGGVSAAEELPVFNAEERGAEGAVAEELGVEAAVEGVIDFFGHHAVEGRAHWRDDV
jgi:hypothetical protein